MLHKQPNQLNKQANNQTALKPNRQNQQSNPIKHETQRSNNQNSQTDNKLINN